MFHRQAARMNAWPITANLMCQDAKREEAKRWRGFGF